MKGGHNNIVNVKNKFLSICLLLNNGEYNIKFSIVKIMDFET